MNKLWDILGVAFFLVGVFLLVFYYRGTVEVLGAARSAVTSTIDSLQGKDAYGRLPGNYPG